MCSLSSSFFFLLLRIGLAEKPQLAGMAGAVVHQQESLWGVVYEGSVGVQV